MGVVYFSIIPTFEPSRYYKCWIVCFYNTSFVSGGWRIGVFWNLQYMSGLLGQFYSGFQETIRKSDEKVEIVLQPFEYDHLSEFADVFSKNQFQGAIIGGLSEADSKYLKENTFEIPIVLINQTLENYSSVYVDDYQTGRQCAELFYENGHKRAGIVFSENRSAASVLRYNGFAEECRKCGIQVREEWKVTGEGNGAGGYRAMKKLLESEELPTALFIHHTDEQDERRRTGGSEG